MTDVRETRLPGLVPRYEIPGWRERYGVVAGITGRGDTPGTGFDLGFWTREPVAEVMSRWREFRRAEPGFEAWVMAHQVHGSEIARHGACSGWIIQDGVDGHLTTAPGILLLVTVADCIPVYLAVPSRRAVSLLHAGWRGAAGGILERGVARLATDLSISPADIIMHCGIGICGKCYEVESEVMAGCGLAAGGTGPWYLDLRAHLRERANRLGIVQVTISGWCSAHDHLAFYSHRASGGTDGRMVAYLGYPRAS